MREAEPEPNQPKFGWQQWANRKLEQEYIVRTCVCCFLMETASFVFAPRGRARDPSRSGHSGPKTIAASWPQSFPEPMFSEVLQRSWVGGFVFAGAHIP